MGHSPRSQSIGEGSIYAEKRKGYRGAVKYPLHCLVEENERIDPRQTDPKNIKRLLNIFKLEGCCRFEAQNHIPALISHDQYERLINGLPDRGSQLKNCDVEPPQTNSAETLVCLHGKHRLEAARRYLGSGEKWWIVDLYSDGCTGPAL